MSTAPLYPGVTVQLTGQSGNIFAIMGRVTSAMREAGVDEHTVIRPFVSRMFGCASYDEALGVVREHVTVT